jgi:hypothetical protein
VVFTALALAAALTAAPPETNPKPPADSFRPDPTWTTLGPSLWFDPKGKRLVMRARVALREGALEHLLCLKGTKEHEAILATPATPRLIHAGLLLTGAKEGHPVRFVPKFEPPEGSAIAIELEWQADDKTMRADAREWIRDERTKGSLEKDWVFAGSEFIDDPINKKRLYAADDGDLVTVANFRSAILDLPFASTANDVERSFVANTPRIPPQGTPVTMYLRPRPTEKKKKD